LLEEAAYLAPFIHGRALGTGEKRRKESFESPNSLPLVVQVFMTREFLKCYPKMSHMSSLYFLHERSLIRYIRRVLNAYLDYFFENPVIVWPDDEQLDPELEVYQRVWKSMLEDDRLTREEKDLLKKAVLVVDGIEVRISRPVVSTGSHDRWFSAKTRQYSVSVQAVSTIAGDVASVSTVQNIHCDQQQWNQLHLRSRFVNKCYGVLADGGYALNPVNIVEDSGESRILGATPFRRSKKRQLTEHERAFNEHLSKRRVIVENLFARVKRYEVLGGTFRHLSVGEDQPFIDINTVVQVVFSLVSWTLKSEPLRREQN